MWSVIFFHDYFDIATFNILEDLLYITILTQLNNCFKKYWLQCYSNYYTLSPKKFLPRIVNLPLVSTHQIKFQEC